MFLISEFIGFPFAWFAVKQLIPGGEPRYLKTSFRQNKIAQFMTFARGS
jgi:hypothetical protein